MKNYNKVIAAVVAGIVCSAVTSQASLVLVGPGASGTSVNAGYTAPVGANVGDTGALAYSFGGGLDVGSVETQVYNNDINNTLGGLTFLYTIVVTSGDIGGITLNGNWAGQVAIADVTGSAQSINNFNYKADGSNIRVNWAGAPYSSGLPVTLQFVIDTSSKADALTLAGLQDSAPDGGANILSPVPVPEPATVVAGALLLLPLGIGAARSLRKERVA